MQLRIEVGGMTHIKDLPPEPDTMDLIIIELALYDELQSKDIVRTQRVVYIRNGEIKVS